MKPYLHANISRKLHGGTPEDYMPIHNMMDSTGAAHADIRHRAIFHSSFGCHLIEQMFGCVATNSEGKQYSPRDIAEEHIMQDLGFIPTLSNYLDNMQIQNWMSGTEKKTRKFRKSRFITMEESAT